MTAGEILKWLVDNNATLVFETHNSKCGTSRCIRLYTTIDGKKFGESRAIPEEEIKFFAGGDLIMLNLSDMIKSHEHEITKLKEHKNEKQT